MNQGKIGFSLLTKWEFEATKDADSPSTISTGDVADEESRESLDACVDPCTDAINNPDVGSLNSLWETDEFADEADSFGGWIVETQGGTRKALDLFDAEAPRKECIAQSYSLHKMPPLLWL